MVGLLGSACSNPNGNSSKPKSLMKGVKCWIFYFLGGLIITLPLQYNMQTVNTMYTASLVPVQLANTMYYLTLV